MSRNSPRNGIRISRSLHATQGNTGPVRACVWTLLYCFVARFVHSCILPRPSTQTGWVAQSRNTTFSTSASNSQFSILNRIRIHIMTAQRTTPNAQRESHLGSVEEAGSRSLFAHVSGPYDAPIIPYHVVLSSPASFRSPTASQD